MWAQTPLIRTVAGSGAGVGLVSARNPAVDSQGNIYVADNATHIVLKITPAGTTSIVAGTGAGGYNGDNIQATAAQLFGPRSVVFDSADNMYIADYANHRVRRVDAATGMITTVAGTGTAGNTGDGGLATLAQINNPEAVTVDSGNNIFISVRNNWIRRFQAGGNISTVAGNGTSMLSGMGGPAANAGLGSVLTIAAGATGIYVATFGDNSGLILKFTVGGNIAIHAGNDGVCNFLVQPACWNGTTSLATSTTLDLSETLWVHGGFVYFNPEVDYRVARVPEAAGGNVTAVAGNGTSGNSGNGGPALAAQIPAFVGITAFGSYIYLSSGTDVRRFQVGGNMEAFLTGSNPNFGGDGGAATNAKISSNLARVAFDSQDNMYIPDLSNNGIRRVMKSTGVITTIAGIPGTPGPTSGTNPLGTGMSFSSIAVDSSNRVYIGDLNYRVWRFTPGMMDLTSIAGTGAAASNAHNANGDGGPATSAQFGSVDDVVVRGSNVWVADGNMKRIRRFSVGGNITAPVWNPNATFFFPRFIDVSSNETDLFTTLLVQSFPNPSIYEVRQLLPASTQLTATGNPLDSITIHPLGGVVYTENQQVKRYNGGTITVLVGVAGTAAYNGDNIPATTAHLRNPKGLAFDSRCNLYISDPGNQRVRMVPNLVQVTVGTSPAGLSFVVDGQTYTSQQIFFWESGTQHNIQIANQAQGDGSPTRNVFQNWGTLGSNASQNVTAPDCGGSAAFTATFQTQHRLTLSVSPPGTGTLAGSPADAGGGYYPAGQVVTLTATPAANYQFANFSGDALSQQSPPQVTMNAPKNITANFVAVTATTGSNATATYSLSSQNVTLNATVTSVPATVNTGTVTFTVKNGAATVGSPVTSGIVTGGNASAVFVLPAGTAAGNYTIEAVYNPGAGFLGSSDLTKTLTVQPAGTSTSPANASAPLSAADQTVNLTATVTSAAGVVAAGTVMFTLKDGAATIGTPVSAGVAAGAASANYTLPGGTPAGSYTIQADYSGTVNLNASSGMGILTVVAPPVIAKAFGASNIALNGSTSLTFTITNPAANTVALTGVGFPDPLPAGLIVATPNGLTNSCGGAVTAVAGAGLITLSGGAVSANGSCTLTVNVTGTATGVKNNTTGAVSSTNGGTGNMASASISVASPPSISKSFGALSIPVGGMTTLTFTISNPNATLALTGVGFSDTLPAGLVVATPNNLSNTCGGTPSAVPGTGVISLSGGGLAASGSCTLLVDILGLTSGVKNNTSGNVTSNEAGNGGTASASITVVGPPAFSKAFGSASIPLNGSTSLTFSISNPNPVALTGIGFSDTLPAGLQVASPNGLSNTCGGAVTATAGGNVISLTAGSLASGTACTASVNVTATTAGDKVNVSGNIAATESGAGGTASASLTVVAPPSIAKAFGVASMIVNDSTSLTLVITNPAVNTVAQTGVAFSDPLPAGLVVATPAGVTNNCGGAVTAANGSASISLAGGTVAVNGNCTISVNVTGATTGIKNNTTGAVSSANGGTGLSSNTATLLVNPPTPVTVTTSPAGLAIVVDGTTHTAPQTFQWNPGSTHTIAVTSPHPALAPGTRYLFNNWSDGGAVSHTVTTPTAAATFTAVFDTQHQLTLAIAPALAGTATPVSGGWYMADTLVPIQATPSAGFAFANWTGGTVTDMNLSPTTVRMNGPRTLTANFAVVPPCVYTLSRSSASVSGGGDLGFFSVNTTPACSWTGVSDSSWAVITNGASGNGNGTVRFRVAPNPTASTRTANLTIAGHGFQLMQGGGSCTHGLTPQVIAAPETAGGFASAVSTQGSCGWTPSPSPNWITTALTPSSGSATLSFGLVHHSGQLPRTGAIQVAGQAVQILQRSASPVQVFQDVNLGHPFADYIGLIRANGITLGCTATTFCPEDMTTRAQMAAFIIRALFGETFEFPSSPYFTDVQAGHPMFKYVQKMREMGITSGCSASTYCPDQAVTRGQMAVFIIRARYRLAAGDNLPFPAAPFFDDAPTSHPFFGFIQKMKQRGITSGCSASSYCPEDAITRGQMSVFIVRGLLTP